MRNKSRKREILRERLLIPRNISPQELAQALKVPKEQRADITPDLAARLALYFDSSVEFWLNLQRSYEEEISKEKTELLKEEIIPYKVKNVKEYLEDKRDFNMFAVEKGAKTANLHLELIQGTKNHYSIRTGGP
ncbi:4531_t:CDS:2 [Entrophospora sp. SA101]|nr:6279_t:CDS:2 [Entrophospora sp. SA101]CAJ0760364.1 4531_t:CDS:2 [Entrophospora sp. SA101]CAJ0842929.1 13677_t:CDS:2 [Entrophospora sp. SA101]